MVIREVDEVAADVSVRTTEDVVAWITGDVGERFEFERPDDVSEEATGATDSM